MNRINDQLQIHSKRQVVQDKYKNVPKPYMNVAEGMEAQFTNHLLAQMRKTVHSVTPDSQAEIIYKSMLDDERSQLMAKSSTGLGIKDLVLQQIYPHFRPSSPSMNAQHSAKQAVNNYQKVTSQKGELNE